MGRYTASTMTMKVHGIPTCDTVRRARAWLAQRGVAYDWVDFRKTPPAAADLTRWAQATGWETLLNRRGTTWRALDESVRARVVDEASALRLMRAQPALIKRPVIEVDGAVVVGFDETDYTRRFARR